MSSASYGGTAWKGGAVTGISQGIKMFLQIASVAAVARFLPPSEFGIYAMVGPVVAFVTLFQDIGLQQAIIQHKDITPEQISRLFWINLAMSCSVAVVVMACAPLAAWFYGEPRVLPLTLAWAVPIMLTALGKQHLTLMTRSLRFSDLALIDVVASVANLIASVFLAWQLKTLWALWGGMVMAALTTMFMGWIRYPWRPMSPFLKADVGHHVKFGANLAGFNFLNYFARNLDNVIVAKFFGAVALGFYDRSYKLLLAPLSNVNAPVSRIVLPILARLKDEPERYRNAYLRTAALVSWLCAPGIFGLAIVSQPFVLLLLGKDWLAAAPIFAWLGLAGLTQPFSNTIGWLFISQHRTRHMFLWSLFGSSTTIISFFAGIPWGVAGTAAAYALSNVFLRLPAIIWWAGREGPVSMSDMRLPLTPVILGGIVTWSIMWAVDIHLALGPVLTVAVSVILSYLSTLAMIFLQRSTRHLFFASFAPVSAMPFFNRFRPTPLRSR